jgi:hypothetical protein
VQAKIAKGRKVENFMVAPIQRQPRKDQLRCQLVTFHYPFGVIWSDIGIGAVYDAGHQHPHRTEGLVLKIHESKELRSFEVEKMNMRVEYESGRGEISSIRL